MFYLHLFCTQGREYAGAYPRRCTPQISCQLIAGPTQIDKQPSILTPLDHLELQINLPCMSLASGRKLEFPERTSLLILLVFITNTDTLYFPFFAFILQFIFDVGKYLYAHILVIILLMMC